MTKHTGETVQVTPIFDFELLCSLLQETRLGGQVLENLAKTWERWIGQLQVRKLEAGGRRYLALWLDEAVEQEVDEVWAKSASEGFRLNCLAQTLCMGAIYQVLPEVEDAGCAPAPKPTPELAAALEDEGIPYLEAGGPTLSRRFSVLTNFPFKGACDICYLRDDCPKAGGSGDSFHSIELSGPETPVPPTGKLQ